MGKRNGIENRWSRPSRGSGWIRTFALTIVLLLSGTGSAWSLTIQDINPAYFPFGGGNTGIVNVVDVIPPIDFQSSTGDRFLCAGDGTFIADGICTGKTRYDLTIEQGLTIVHQNPQARNETPTSADPFIADSVWTVTNTSGEVFDEQILLLFTNANLTEFEGRLTPGPYPDLLVGLDRDLLEVVRHDAGATFHFYVAGLLGPLDIDESAEITVRYVVANGPVDQRMPIVDGEIVMPPLSVLGFVVPEPASVLLVALGLAGLAVARWRGGCR